MSEVEEGGWPVVLLGEIRLSLLLRWRVGGWCGSLWETFRSWRRLVRECLRFEAVADGREGWGG